MIVDLSRGTILKKEKEVDCVNINGQNWYSATLYFFSLTLTVLTIVVYVVSAVLSPVLETSIPYTRYGGILLWALGLFLAGGIIHLLVWMSRIHEAHEAAWIAAQCAIKEAAQREEKT
jgi:cytochrome c biogenesis protein CcdA